MRINEMMTRNPVCISPDATLQDAAGQMRDLYVGSLPVCEENRLVGLLTDRDVTVRASADGRDPRSDRVRDCMSKGVSYCYDDQDVREVAEIMRQKQIRRIPVLNRQKRLVGIVSLGDLALQTGDEQLTGQTLEGISEPNRSE